MVQDGACSLTASVTTEHDMEFTAAALLATVTGAVAAPIAQQPPTEDEAAHRVPQQPAIIVTEEQGSGKTPVQKLMECASKLESEDTKLIQARENRTAAEQQYKEAYQRFQFCKKEVSRIQRRRQAAYQYLLQAVHDVGGDVKEQ